MQGASWSSMDFGGNWRLLHYSMKKTYAPFLIVATSQDDSSEIWGISDINEPVTGRCLVTSHLHTPTHFQRWKGTLDDRRIAD